MSDLIPDEVIADKTVKDCYRVEWDSKSYEHFWPGEHRSYSLSKDLWEHGAICDTFKGAHAVYQEAISSGATNVRVAHWTVVTITTKEQEFVFEASGTAGTA